VERDEVSGADPVQWRRVGVVVGTSVRDVDPVMDRLTEATPGVGVVESEGVKCSAVGVAVAVVGEAVSAVRDPVGDRDQEGRVGVLVSVRVPNGMGDRVDVQVQLRLKVSTPDALAGDAEGVPVRSCVPESVGPGGVCEVGVSVVLGVGNMVALLVSVGVSRSMGLVVVVGEAVEVRVCTSIVAVAVAVGEAVHSSGELVRFGVRLGLDAVSVAVVLGVPVNPGV